MVLIVLGNTAVNDFNGATLFRQTWPAARKGVQWTTSQSSLDSSPGDLSADDAAFCSSELQVLRLTHAGRSFRLVDVSHVNLGRPCTMPRASLPLGRGGSILADPLGLDPTSLFEETRFYQCVVPTGTFVCSRQTVNMFDVIEQNFRRWSGSKMVLRADGPYSGFLNADAHTRLTMPSVLQKIKFTAELGWPRFNRRR